jgi:uncharacterized protein YicC (UPF0701 family)
MELNPTQVGVWIGVVVLLVPAVKVIVDWIRPQTRRIEPQPLEVTLAAKYVTAEDCLRMHGQQQRFEDERFTNLSTQIGALTEALDRRNTEGEARASLIHQRINVVVESVSELRGKVDNHIENHP